MTNDATQGDDPYLAQLDRAVRRLGLGPEHAAEVVCELADHLRQSGERPREAFGDPEHYAATLVAADQPEGGPEAGYERRTFRATALDELQILADLGRDGWELTGVRDFGLHARRPVSDDERIAWEYARRSGVRREPLVHDMAADGWMPCGRWVTFHYFKRPAHAGT